MGGCAPPGFVLADFAWRSFPIKRKVNKMLNILAALAGRLSVSRKLMLIYLLDLTAVIFITTILIEEKYIAINFARKEAHGNQYIASVRDALFWVVRAHDGALPPGSALPLGPLADAQQRLDQEMESGREAGNFERAMQTAALAGDENRLQFSRQAFDAGRKLVARIGDQSNLILDPDLDSYYTMSLSLLRFPELLELLMQLPDTRNQADNSKFLMVAGKLAALQESIASDYQSAYNGNASGKLQLRLTPTHQQLVTVLRQLLQASEREAGTDAAELKRLRMNAVDATEAAWRESSAAVADLLDERINFLLTRMWIHLGTAGALLAIILFLVFFIARQISRPLRQLAGVAEEVKRSNDYSLRATWGSQDEIGRLVVGFNSMLEKLDRERLQQQELAAQARAAEAQRELLEAIPIPLIVTSIPDHQILHANGPAIHWVDPDRVDPWAKGLDSGPRARFFQRLADEGCANEFEVCWHGPRGDSWALLAAHRLNYQGFEAIVTTFAPINTIKRMEARLSLWAKVFEAASEGILVVDCQQRILLANSALARTTGYRIDEIVGREPDFLRATCHNADYQGEIDQAVTEKGQWHGEYWLKRKNGVEVPHLLMMNIVRDEDGAHSHTIAVYIDISERKANEERVRHLAHHDMLTGLPNRLLFDERLRMSLQTADRRQERLAILFIDLDRFKNINDSLGHHVGDGLLKSVADRLQNAVRPNDTVCRQGGDEFVVILASLDSTQEAVHIIERRLIPLINQPHLIDSVNLHISCSIGIAIYPDDGADIDTLMRNADAAMYAAKANGRNNFQFFTESMNHAAFERLSLENSLREALEREEFELFFQPVVDVRSRQISYAEVLLRWRHRTQGLIPPTRFIPIAEESGLILDIGRWVIEEACRQHARWRESGLGTVRLAVNIAASQFAQAGFVDMVAAALESSGTAAEYLELELTETAVMKNDETVLSCLHCLRDMGVSLSLDDFGTGYSSLNYLHRFPLDRLKIDRSFIHDMLEDPAHHAITRAIIGLGHTLGLRVVAEGVEYEEELRLLEKMDCDEIQGYYFSRPMPTQEFVPFLLEWREIKGKTVFEPAVIVEGL